MTQLWSLAVYTDADATIYNAESEPDAYFLLIQDPPPGAGHDRGRDCADTEALALSAVNSSVTQVFCIECLQTLSLHFFRESSFDIPQLLI